MKKFLFLLTATSVSLWGQVFSQTLITSSIELANNIVFNSSAQYQKTIGFYPQRALTCFEAVSEGTYRGFLTIANINGKAKTYKLQPQIMIRDMYQMFFTDTVYFCGTHIISDIYSGSVDSVGVWGYFVAHTDSTIDQLTYSDVTEVEVLTNLVTVRMNGHCTMAATGRKNINNAPVFYFVKGYKAPSYNIVEYDICPLNPQFIPKDIITTDDNVALVSLSKVSNNTFAVRRFFKHDLDNVVRNYLYTYILNEGSTFGPKSTFLGCKFNENGENDIAVVFIGMSLNNSWKTYLKSIYLPTMQMTNAQHLNMFDKNDIWGITYLSNRKNLAVLEPFEPNYIHYNPTVVVFKPSITNNYSSHEFFDRNGNFWQNVADAYETIWGSSYFICSYTNGNSKYYLTHDVGVSEADNCLKKYDIEIEIDKTVQPTTISNPLQFTHHTAYTYGAVLYPYIETKTASCSNDK